MGDGKDETGRGAGLTRRVLPFSRGNTVSCRAAHLHPIVATARRSCDRLLSRRTAWERLSTIDVANAVARPGAPGTTATPSRPPAVFRPLPFSGDDTALLAALKVGHPGAVATFYDRFTTHVQRILVRVLGADRELADVHHDVFVRALGSIKDVTEPAALKAWVTQVAVFTARTCIQRRSRRWWLRILPPDEVPEAEATVTTAR